MISASQKYDLHPKNRGGQKALLCPLALTPGHLEKTISGGQQKRSYNLWLKNAYKHWNKFHNTQSCRFFIAKCFHILLVSMFENDFKSMLWAWLWETCTILTGSLNASDGKPPRSKKTFALRNTLKNMLQSVGFYEGSAFFDVILFLARRSARNGASQRSLSTKLSLQKESVRKLRPRGPELMLILVIKARIIFDTEITFRRINVTWRTTEEHGRGTRLSSTSVKVSCRGVGFIETLTWCINHYVSEVDWKAHDDHVPFYRSCHGQCEYISSLCRLRDLAS